MAGSFFYLGAAYAASWSYFLAVMMGTFSAVLFLRCPAGASGRFGSATLAYLWYLGVNYLFFVGPEGYPAGLLVVVPYDLIISKRLGRYSPAFVTGIASLFLAMLYGIVYFPLLPLSDALAFNPYLIASFLGLGLETAVELLWSRGRVRDSGLENVN